MEDDFYQKLLGLALNLVSIRPRSEKEIRDYLVKKINKWGVSESLIDDILTRLSELGYVDDAAFARSYITSVQRFRPKGNRLIGLELLRKGVKKDVIERVLRALEADVGTGSDTEAIMAQKAALKKLRGLQGYDKESQRKKLYAFLLRRGFSYDTVTSVIDGLMKKELQ